MIECVISNVPAGSSLGFTLLNGAAVVQGRTTAGVYPPDGGAEGGTYLTLVDPALGADRIVWDTGGSAPVSRTVFFASGGASAVALDATGAGHYSTRPLLPPGSLSGGGLVYWSVQTQLQDASGNVVAASRESEPWTFFLDAPAPAAGVLPSVGAASYALVTQGRDSDAPLQLLSTGVSPGVGSVDQSLYYGTDHSFPLVCAAFSVSLAAGQEGLFRVTRTSLYDYRGDIPVAGSWALASGSVLSPKEQPASPGTCMVFTPAEPYLPNYRYTVSAPASLTSTDGQTLEEPLRWHWVSWYTPFHIDPYRVRQRLGEYSGYIEDEQLYYQVWRASVRANRELVWYVPAGYYRGGPSESEVINFTVFHSMALAGYVELEAVIRILEGLIGVGALDAGVSESFKESEVRVSPDRIQGINAAIKAFRHEWETYRAEISMKRPRPRSAIKAANWRAGVAGRDLGYSPRGSIDRGRGFRGGRPF